MSTEFCIARQNSATSRRFCPTSTLPLPILALAEQLCVAPDTAVDLDTIGEYGDDLVDATWREGPISAGGAPPPAVRMPTVLVLGL